MISKLGMTISSIGIAEEYKNHNICSCSLWPETAIESFAIINHKLGNKKDCRKPSILTDCLEYILKENPKEFSGSQLLDETYLSKGITDFDKYRCDPNHEPQKISDLLWNAGISKL